MASVCVLTGLKYAVNLMAGYLECAHGIQQGDCEPYYWVGQIPNKETDHHVKQASDPKPPSLDSKLPACAHVNEIDN